MLTLKRDAAVVQPVLDMARNFELATIAEGIETSAVRISEGDRLRGGAGLSLRETDAGAAIRGNLRHCAAAGVPA